MQTRFKPEQLSDPHMAASEGVIRTCVHCGFCTATCPTYVLLGDERDSPRGRIYLIKEMLEAGVAPSADVVKHVDRCLSCLACVTACPSGVDYARLIDHARVYIEARYRRAPMDRFWRGLLAWVLPSRARLRAALALAFLFKPIGPLLARLEALRPAAALLALSRPLPRVRPETPTPQAVSRGRVILLRGCAEAVIAPQIRAATVRLLHRTGYDVASVPEEGCCGALVHHLGREAAALAACRRNIDAWSHLLDAPDVVAIVTTASGCGVMLKDYGHLLGSDAVYAERAKRISEKSMEISAFMERAGLPPLALRPSRLNVAYQAPCSLQHGLRAGSAPLRLLKAAGFQVAEPVEAHLCSGSAGTYNILQPALSERLRNRKVEALERSGPDVIATANIGCLTQIRAAAATPVVHVAELLDWVTGGPQPFPLERAPSAAIRSPS
jgi:glycolate oxidase iron-sulfur subunit